MKVFLVNTNKKWGGGEKWHFDMAGALKKQGHQIALLSDPNTELYTKAVSAGLTVIPIKITNISFLNPFIIYHLKRLFQNEKPDAVILNFSSDVKTVGTAAKLAGIQNIIYRRGNAKPLKNTILNRFLYNKIINHIVVNSIETGNSLLKNNRQLLPADKITVVYNGINIRSLDNHVPVKIYDKKENEIVVGTAGRLSPEKGHMYLLEMAKNLKDQGLRFVLLIAGEGPLESELKNKTKELGLEAYVKYTGFVKEMKNFLDAVDIFVLPSLWEGFGYVTVEAMACSKPVVAFRVGSNPEVVADNETGLLAEPYDVNAFTKYVMTLAQNAAMRNSMGLAGRLRAMEKFDMERSVEMIEKLLSGLKKFPG